MLLRVSSAGNARRLRRNQTKEERELWRALRAGRFAGFKFRRQHPLGPYFLDFYCPLARLAVELDGFCHGTPDQLEHDLRRERFLAESGVEELRFWNHQWRHNHAGVLLDIWRAVYRRTGCLQVIRKDQNNRFVAPSTEQLSRQKGLKIPRQDGAEQAGADP